MRKVDTLEFLKLLEQINNIILNPPISRGLRVNLEKMPLQFYQKKWIELTNAIGIRVKFGKNGGTFAHIDIALEFASWISAEVKLYITDLARFLNEDDPRYPIQNWMRLKDTIDFICLWEILNNENFNRVEFDAFKLESGKKTFVITPTKWISKTNAIGIKTKIGKYGGGTFAHRDIALEFASWISAEVKLYIIKEFQRLKIEESEQLEWQGKRLLTKIKTSLHGNY